jgi:hypothetical protein
MVSSVLMEPISKAFAAAIEAFATTHQIPLITFAKDERKDDQAGGHHMTAVFRTEYRLSIWQAEFSLTQVLDRPATGRAFFEEVIRENLDLGRPDQVQLIFDRRVHARTPGRFRTRVITEGVTPSLHVDYKRARIKQYHKEGRALRTETTLNRPRDFGIGKGLTHLSAPRKVGFQANRRLVNVQRISHDCAIGDATFARLSRPAPVSGQRVSALPFADPLVQALLGVLILFRLVADGWRQRAMAAPLAALLGVGPATLTAGRLTYHLRRLRLHGLIERVPRTHRYRVTTHGLRVALFFTRTHARLFRPGLALVIPDVARDDDPLRRAIVSKPSWTSGVPRRNARHENLTRLR